MQVSETDPGAPTGRRITRRQVVTALAVISGLAGELLAAVSMTRIAGPVTEVGGKLGFPVDGWLDLRWTLFAVVSVAGWAGAVLWTSPVARHRRRGAPINVFASALAGVAVGLDHAVHADPAGAWRYVAFGVGVAICLFSSVMVHLISHMAVDRDAEQADAPSGVAPSAGPANEEAGSVGSSPVAVACEPSAEPEPFEAPVPAPRPLRSAPGALLRDRARAAYRIAATKLLDEGGDLDSIVANDIDRAVGASVGYSKKHVRTWRAELLDEREQAVG